MKFLATILITLCMTPIATAPAKADPVVNTDAGLYVKRIVPKQHDRIRVTFSDGYVTTLSPCIYEDGRRCYWQADERGNRKGKSFVVARGRIFYMNLAGL